MCKTTILAAAFAAALTADGPAQAQTASCERAKEKHGAGNVQCSSNPETVRTDPARDEVHDTIALIRKPTWAVLQGLDARFLGGCSVGFEALGQALQVAAEGVGDAVPVYDLAPDFDPDLRPSVVRTCRSVEYDAFKALHLFPEWLDSERAVDGCRDLFRRHNTKWTELSACLYVHADLERLIASAESDEADN